MRILKPLRIGCMTRIVPGVHHHQIVVTGLICWDLLAPDTWYSDQKLWGTVNAQFSGSTNVLDQWMPKLRGEFLVCGKAVAPMGVPVSHLNVSVSVGALRKRIAVSGDRFWRPGLLRVHTTDAAPFLEVPITYERAFGGDGYPDNPVGMGYRAQRRVDDGQNVQLPNLLSPSRPILHQTDEPMPCTLGAVDFAWPGKLSSTGTFDKNWFKERYPLPPSDFDFRIYNVAPPDQQLDRGFFVGDESVCIDAMHDSQPEIRSHLPGLSMRLFVAKTGCSLLETSVRLDTVWLFPSALTGVALYRAVINCDDADARDIDAIMLACERLDQIRPIVHYEETYRLRTEAKTKALYALADDQLMPEVSPETKRELDSRRQEVKRNRSKKWQAQSDHFKAMTVATTGVAVSSAAAELGGKVSWLEGVLPIVLPEDIARGNVDFAGVQRAADVLRQRGRDMRAAASQLVPPAFRGQMGFSAAEEAAGAKQSEAQITELLGLQDMRSIFEGKAADFLALLESLEANPALSVSQELSRLMEKYKDDERLKIRAMIRDPNLLAFLDESEAAQIELARQIPAVSIEPMLPEMRAGMMSEIREMAKQFSLGILDVPLLDSPESAMLKAFGIHVDPAGISKWPPGKLGALIQSRMQQAVEEDGLVGMAELSAKLQLASLQALPPEVQARMLPDVERQVGYSLSEARTYRLAYPEAEKRFSEAFSKPLTTEDILVPDVADGMTQLRKVAGDVGDPTLKECILNLIDQTGAMISAAMEKTLPGFVQDGKVDYQRLQQEIAAEAIMLAGYRLPANDELPENDWLTYDKRFVIALATASISRLGLPFTLPSTSPVSNVGYSNSDAANPAALSDLVQQGERMMRDGRFRSPVVVPHVGEHEAEVAAHLGAWILSAHRRGVSLAGRDMAGANLRGADLRGADLTGAFLERADLTDAKLDSALCDEIVLSGALLTRASFRRASMRKANLGQVKARQAIFAEADLSDAQLYQAELTQADCTGAVLDRVAGIECVLQNVRAQGSRCAEAQFSSANLRGIELDRAHWNKVIFIKGDMSGFQAAEAQLEECVWVEVNLSQGSVEGAQLRASQFNDCDCDGLHAERVRAADTCWVKGSMLGVKFSLAVLDNSLFESTLLEGADFHRARMSGATLMRVNLKTASMGQAQLTRARFHNADLSDADLRFANVHGADFTEACLDRADLTGARRIGTLLEIPRANPVH